MKFLLILSFLFVGSVSAMQIESVSYTGDGNNNHQVTLAFGQPDAIFIKKEGFGGGAGLVLKTASMPATEAKIVGTALGVNLVNALNSNGFLVGTAAGVNTNVAEYHVLAFKSDSVDFVEATYTGNGIDNTSVGSFSFDPVIVISVGDNTEQFWIRTATMAPGNSDEWIPAGALQATDRIQNFLEGAYQIGTDAGVNSDGIDYFYVVQDTVTGFNRQGEYPGTSVDDRDIAMPGLDVNNFFCWEASGFQDGPGWHPNALAASDITLAFGSFGGVANVVQSHGNEVVQLGSLGGCNQVTENIRYIAFADGDSNPSVDAVVFPRIRRRSFFRRGL